MTWESFKEKSVHLTHGGQPYVRVIMRKDNYSSLYLNVPFTKKYNIENNRWAEFFYDKQNDKIGIKFHSLQSETFYYKVTLTKSKSGNSWGWLATNMNRLLRVSTAAAFFDIAWET